MPRLLAIDTSTEACSVALYDGVNMREQSVDAPREHVQRILPMIDAVLAERAWTLHDVDAIAFARGPGSFTGLRICLGVVQGLAYGANLPVLPVSTLAAIAQTAVDSQAIDSGDYLCSAIDARMDEIYCGWFCAGDGGLVFAVSEESVCKPEAMPLINISAKGMWHGVGTGWRYGERLPHSPGGNSPRGHIDVNLLPRASAVARLAVAEWNKGVRLSASEAQPVYLRNEVAWVKDPRWAAPDA